MSLKVICCRYVVFWKSLKKYIQKDEYVVYHRTACDCGMTNPQPKLITGPLHADNKQASDWGHQGFISYGCHRHVVVVDPKTQQVIQTLGPHSSSVTHVKWSREKYHHAFATGRTYGLTLAAADSAGNILIWDVVSGNIRTEFQRPSVHIRFLELEWLPGHDESHDLLLVLRYPGQLELWDAYAGVQLWKTEFGENLLSFVLDPFNVNRLICMSEVTHLVLVSDINTNKQPQTDNFKYLWYSDPNPVVNSAQSSLRRHSSGEKLPRRASSSSWTRMANIATNMLPVAASESLTKRWSISEDQDTLSSCLQTVFSPIHNNVVLVVFSTEVQFIDVDLDLVVATIRIDRVSPYIVKVIPCHTADILFCLHDNGSTSVRIRKQKTADQSDSHEALNMTYEQCSLSDSIRLLRQVKIVGFLHHPITEKQVAILLSDSKIILLDSMPMSFHKDDPTEGQNNITLGETVNGLTVVLPGNRTDTNQEEIILRMITSGLMSGLNYPITCISMRPSILTLNEVGQHLAVGSGCGAIQLVNVYTGQVDHEYKLFSCPVRGMQWIKGLRIVAYTYTEPSSYGNREVRNEIVVLDTSTGEINVIIERGKNEGPLQFVQLSPSGTYMTVAVKGRPVEIWNIHTKQLLKELTGLPDKPSSIVWHPSVVKVTEKGRDKRTWRIEQCFISISHETLSLIRVPISDGIVQKKIIFTNEVIFGQNTSKIDLVVWKDHFLILADKTGQIYLKQNSTARKFIMKPGAIAKSIRFAPGKGNFKFLVLYEQSLDVWEIDSQKISVDFVTSCPSMNCAFIDATWTGPESVAIVTEDFCLHVMKIAAKGPTSPVRSAEDDFVHVKDSSIKTSGFPMKNWKLSDVFSPALLDRKRAFLLKYSLQCTIEPFNSDIEPFMKLISSEMSRAIKNSQFTCDRCLLIARLFGDEYDQEFWEIFKYVSRFGRTDTTLLGDLGKPFDFSEWITKLQSTPTQVHDLLDLSTSDLETKLISNDLTKSDLDSSWVNGLVKEREPYIASSFGLFMDHAQYKSYEASRLLLQNKRASSYQVKKVCASRFIMMEKIAMATQVLMETDTDNIEFRNDCMKACLTSCIHMSNESMGTLKLAATHLIAAGHLQEGVDLLCLMGKQTDACRYMISYRNWLDAVWLAKISLSEKEVLAVVCKYAEHLWSNSQKMKAVLLMMSVGQYTTVLRMLFSLGQYDTAALFLQACVEQGLLSNVDNTDEVFLEFAKFLLVTQYQSAVEYYCQQAGEKGQSLLQGIKSINKTLNSN